MHFMSLEFWLPSASLMGSIPCTLHLGHPPLLTLLHLSNHYFIPAHLDPRLSTLFRFPFESLSTPTPAPTPQLNPKTPISASSTGFSSLRHRRAMGGIRFQESSYALQAAMVPSSLAQ
jgi:hypothetical protein